MGVKYVSGYTLHVSYADGVEGDIKLDDLVEKGIFKVLSNKDLFAKAYSTGYSIAWSDELEIDADRIYYEISGKSPDDLMHLKSTHASN